MESMSEDRLFILILGLINSCKAKWCIALAKNYLSAYSSFILGIYFSFCFDNIEINTNITLPSSYKKVATPGIMCIYIYGCVYIFIYSIARLLYICDEECARGAIWQVCLYDIALISHWLELCYNEFMTLAKGESQTVVDNKRFGR